MKAVSNITWIISDLLTKTIVCSGLIERNSKIVIKPRGATKRSGNKGILEIFS